MTADISTIPPSDLSEEEWADICFCANTEDEELAKLEEMLRWREELTWWDAKANPKPVKRLLGFWGRAYGRRLRPCNATGGSG